jgi:hypothetical protein
MKELNDVINDRNILQAEINNLLRMFAAKHEECRMDISFKQITLTYGLKQEELAPTVTIELKL